MPHIDFESLVPGFVSQSVSSAPVDNAGTYAGLAEVANSMSSRAVVRPLVFKHLSKIAGTYVIDVLDHVMGHGNWTLVDELFGLTETRKEDGFVISTARNPCDYYVSLWSFDSSKNFALFSMQDGGSAFFQENNTNATKFGNWLSWVQSHGHGIMSYRLYETLVAARDGMSCWDQELGFCGEKFNDTNVELGLSSFSPKDTADCWIHTENLVDDFRVCLKQYEEVTGAKINWDVFEELVHKPHEKGANHNLSEHEHCEYYFDSKTSASVMKSDRHLFEAFGYETCCGAATAEMK